MTSALDSDSDSLLQGLYPDEVTLAGLLAGLGTQIAPIPVLGDVAAPGVYDLPSLAPMATEAASYSAGGTPVSDTYTGVSLWNVLNDAGGVGHQRQERHPQQICRCNRK
ncbi:MAG: hypothetical protein M3Y41_21275 [Pseudomonadota bacterium]|nr:hypothetical protein [Pseudomonadota bacterium]